MEKDRQNGNVINHFEAGSNCQVFNGNISGCVFAMPGANVTQQTRQPSATIGEEERDIVNQLKPIFFGDEDEARQFLVSIQGMKPTQITTRVNQLVAERKISDRSHHRDLWKVLHGCGIYAPSESNWNSQVK